MTSSLATAPEKLLLDIFRLKGEINKATLAITDNKITIFQEITMGQPKFTPSELGFIQTVSWLYGFYFETGRASLTFLAGKFTYFSISAMGTKHLDDVNKLRTFNQHNLNLEKERNREIMRQCWSWFKQNCQKRSPETEEEWERCLIGILSSAASFLKGIEECIDCIYEDENYDLLLAEWEEAVNRYHPPQRFDEIIYEVAQDMGRDHIDPVKIRKSYYERWTNYFKSLSSGYNFYDEARKLAELAIIENRLLTMPIDGRDIMRQLGIKSGPELGNLLELAKSFYEAQIKRKSVPSKEEILNYLSQELRK